MLRISRKGFVYLLYQLSYIASPISREKKKYYTMLGAAVLGNVDLSKCYRRNVNELVGQDGFRLIKPQGESGARGHERGIEADIKKKNTF